MIKEPIYIGDAVYAHVNDRSQLVLTTSHHAIDQADNVIYLEPATWSALKEWMESWITEDRADEDWTDPYTHPKGIV